MENDKNQTSLRDSILADITSGKIKMRPQWHFAFLATLAFTGTVIVLLTALYIVSFTIFSVQRTGVWFVPSFGPHGWFVFFMSLPWILIFLSIIFIIALEILARHYAFMYRRPLLYSVLGVVVIVIGGGFCVSMTPMHRNVALFVERNDMPLARPLYREFGERRMMQVHIGTVLDMNDSGFIIANRQGEILTVTTTPRSQFPFGMRFGVGDTIVVMGLREGILIHAEGMRRIAHEINY